MEGGRAGDHITLDVEHDPLVLSIREKMEAISSKHCICRVDKKLVEENKKAYIPAIVSIGPLHHDNPALVAMEDNKWRYLYALLGRGPDLETSLGNCVKALRDLEHRARLCYGEEIGILTDQFLQIMLVDGCFIIELFLKYVVKGLKRRNDPIFSTPGMLFDLRCDIILLENQIPFFILNRLFEIVPIPEQCTQSLTDLAFRFFRNMIPGDHEFHCAKFSQEGNHLLDLIRHCFLPIYPRVKSKEDSEFLNVAGLKPAITLQAAGFKLKKSKTENLLDIKFTTNGVLHIPPIKIHQYTESLIRNFIALEQCACDDTQHIISYVILLKSFISSPRDVKLLENKEILTNYAQEEEKDVSELFERLYRAVDVRKLKDFYFDGLCEQVNTYRKSSRGKWTKRSKGIIPAPPPRMILVIAVLILVNSFAGTLFSVLSFFLRRS